MEKTLKHRKDRGKKDVILIIADAACFLSLNKCFDECEILEWWWCETNTEWKKNNQNITVICPHSSQILNNSLLSDTKLRISSMHTITIEFNYNMNTNNKKHYNYNLQKISKYQEFQNKRKTKRLLIVEPEPDIQYMLFSFYKTTWL